MNTAKLEILGKAASELRKKSPTKMTPAYLAAIKDIDKEVDNLKALYTNEFYDPNSNEYKALSEQWANERAAKHELI